VIRLRTMTLPPSLAGHHEIKVGRRAEPLPRPARIGSAYLTVMVMIMPVSLWPGTLQYAW
jgi:hypothetical protein